MAEDVLDVGFGNPGDLNPILWHCFSAPSKMRGHQASKEIFHPNLEKSGSGLNRVRPNAGKRLMISN
jgi:hypothetical protein